MSKPTQPLMFLFYKKNNFYKNYQITNKHEGNRTPDFQNRNLMLYPLSYMLCKIHRLFFVKLKNKTLNIYFKSIINKSIFDKKILP